MDDPVGAEGQGSVYKSKVAVMVIRTHFLRLLGTEGELFYHVNFKVLI